MTSVSMKRSSSTGRARRLQVARVSAIGVLVAFVGTFSAGCPSRPSTGEKHPEREPADTSLHAEELASICSAADASGAPKDVAAHVRAAAGLWWASRSSNYASVRALAVELRQLPPARASARLETVLHLDTAEECELAQLLAGAKPDPQSEMVLIDGGPFLMGCDDKTTDDCPLSATPARRVVLSPFEIDRYEVSERKFQDCVEAGVCTAIESCNSYGQHGGVGPEYTRWPASCISWHNAVAYCAWVGKRLPTEAEWEKAARGTDARTYPWGNEAPDCRRAHFADCGPDSKHLPAGLRAVNAYDGPPTAHGLLHMAGNVAEWVQDTYEEYSSQPALDPAVLQGGLGRVVRGGSWTSDIQSQLLRTYARSPGSPDAVAENIGFRCARSAVSATRRLRRR